MSKLGFSVPPSFTSWLDEIPSEFLGAFTERRSHFYEDQRLILWKKDVGYIEIPLKVRGVPGYERRAKESFKQLSDYCMARNLPAVHVRLSPRAPKNVGYSPLESLLRMGEIVNKLLAFIQRRKGFRPDYVWAIEPTERGHCHLHLLLIGMNYLMPKADLDSWFKAHGLGTEAGVWIEALRDSREASRKVLGYLIKYVSKPNHDAKWTALLSLTRRREWGMSSGLRAKVKAYQSEVIERSEKTEPGVFTCTVENNSNSSESWEVIGCMESVLFHALTDGKDVTPDELRTDLAQIKGTIRTIGLHGLVM